MRLRGARYFIASGSDGLYLAEVWNEALTEVEAVGVNTAESSRTPAGADEWRNVWFRPGVHIDSSAWHLLAVTFSGGGIWRNNAALAGGDLVVGHITVPQTFTDANPGGRYFLDFPIFNSPPNNATDNLYGVDILVDDLYP